MDNQHRSVYVEQSEDFYLMDDIEKTIEHLKKHLTTATKNGDRGQETAAYANLGKAYHSLGDHRKAIEYHEKHLKIAIQIGDRNKKEEPIKISVMLTGPWVTIGKPLSIIKTI